jgi:spore coat polysaccharide biosynthesis protein SpsF
MSTACIVQARQRSTRLPGKVLLPLAGRPVLVHVLERCTAIPGVDIVVCAVPEGPADDAVAALAASTGARVFRGDEQDVLGRYLGAARAVDANVVLRVTSDCPLIDPGVCGAVLALRRTEAADYATNNMPPSWPHGLDCEAFTRAALEAADAAATEPHDREHVTPWIRRNPALRRANLPAPPSCRAEQRWTLDFPEDFAFLEALFRSLPTPARDHHFPGLAEIGAVLADNPELVAINAARRQR